MPNEIREIRMAEPAAAADEQQLKRRAMRRLSVALTLIALAIAGLALLDRYNASRKKPDVPAPPPEVRALPGELPKPQPDQPLPVPPDLHLPPPPVVSNEALPDSALPAGSHAPSATPPAAGKAPERAPGRTPAPAPTVAAPAPAPDHKEPLLPAAPGASVKGFLVQVGVFVTPENARSLQAKLAERGIPSQVETRVVVGPFANRAEADAVTRQLKEMGLAGVVVPPR
jgi:cell division septation protein DedD